MTQTEILMLGFDIDLLLIGDKSTWFGKDLDSAVNNCWENFQNWVNKIGENNND